MTLDERYPNPNDTMRGASHYRYLLREKLLRRFSENPPTPMKNVTLINRYLVTESDKIKQVYIELVK